MRIAVIGAPGQVGSEIVRAARAAACDVTELSHADCDVTDSESVERALAVLRPGDAVVNTAAFHKIDDCELDPARAFAVNALGALRVAEAAGRHDASCVYVSSDYVFDGAKAEPYVESDVTRPLSVYGASKMTGEMLVASVCPESYVVRVASVFGVAGSAGKGGNFVETMLSKARAGGVPEVVDDIVMSPTYAADAADALIAIVTQAAPYGIYHLTNAGRCSWYEFAKEILLQAGTGIEPKRSNTTLVPTRARRPPQSALASERVGGLGLTRRPWQEALHDYLKAKGHI